MSNDSASPQPWHVAQWPPLAWLETIIKAAALMIGIRMLFRTLAQPTWQVPSGLGLAQFILLILLSLGLIAAIFDRLAEREIVAMIFVVFNNLGHWGMVLALASKPGPGVFLSLFCGLMLLGDLVKLLFLKLHDFQVRDLPRIVLFGLTLFYVMGYAIILTLEVAR